MQTAEQVIIKLGGNSALAEALKLPVGTVSAWRHRGRIPSRHWSALVALSDKQCAGITFEALVSIESEAA